ncbi:MAG: GNAT family N-acetyltransferase [Bacteroidetes bacterium]|jgi:GNAT superfamily N-acetyltransferase|nr:GNAT family N-acetyltransferase [Bacteroidota bacterium]
MGNEYITVLLTGDYHKQKFQSGTNQLDNYLHHQAGQDVKRKLTAVFIYPGEDQTIKGYYTLSNDALSRKNIPENLLKKLPPAYASLPVTLLGRLAVDKSFQHQGIGALLLADALKRSYHTAVSSIGSMAVVVDPIDENARRFYLKYGFINLPGSGRMFIPMGTIAQLI